MTQGVYLSFIVLILLAAGVAVFGKTMRTQILGSWVTSLLLGALFLILGNETLAFALSLLSTLTTVVMILQTLVFGDFQKARLSSQGFRRHILPVSGALMLLGMIALAAPASVVNSSFFPEATTVGVNELGKVALGKFFVFSIVVAAVAFGAVVGVGMIARADWRREREDG